MEFDKIVKKQAAHKIFHSGGGMGKDLSDLSCQKCYPTKDIIKEEKFDQFWGLVEQMDMGVEGYSEQTIYIFNKLTELSFEKGKLHNASLVAGIRAMLNILKYAEQPKVDV